MNEDPEVTNRLKVIAKNFYWMHSLAPKSIN